MSTRIQDPLPRSDRPAGEVDIDRIVAEVERRLANQPAGDPLSRDGMLRRHLRRELASRRRRILIP